MERKRSGRAQTLVCTCSYDERMGFCRELDGLSTDESSAVSRVGVGISGKRLRQTVEGAVSVADRSTKRCLSSPLN